MSSHTLPAPQTSTTPRTNSRTKPSSENKTPSTELSSTKSSPEKPKQTSTLRASSRQRQRNTTTSLSQHTTPTFNHFRPLESLEQDEVSTLDSPLTAKRNHPPDKTS